MIPSSPSIRASRVRRDQAEALVAVVIGEADRRAVPGGVEDEHVLVWSISSATRASAIARSSANRWAARWPDAVGAGEHDRAPGGVIAAAEHAPRLARLAPEHRVAVEPDDDDIGIDHALALRLERGERLVEPALFGEQPFGRAVALQLRPERQLRIHLALVLPRGHRGPVGAVLGRGIAVERLRRRLLPDAGPRRGKGEDGGEAAEADHAHLDAGFVADCNWPEVARFRRGEATSAAAPMRRRPGLAARRGLATANPLGQAQYTRFFGLMYSTSSVSV